MSRCLEKYWEIFPPILFLCPDNKHSVHFVLSLKSVTDSQKKELVEILHHCGADLSFEVEDATGYSAVIVDHNEVVSVRAPAFKIDYIQDCLSQVKVQNIDNYRQDATSHIARGVECMEVVYYRKKCWETVLTEEDNQWFEEHIDSSLLVECSESQPCNGKSEVCVRRIVETVDGDKEEDEENHRRTANNKDHQLGKRKIISNAESKNREKLPKENSCSKPPTDGMKSSSSSSRETISTKSSATLNKWSFLDEFQSDGSDEDSQTSNKKNTEKEKGKFFDFDVGDEDLFEPTKDKKRTRMPYSYEEQSKILQYIVGHSEFSRIKGRELWMIMERRKICPNRTWQSMKEHFVKKISLNLEAFDFLTVSDRRKIKQVMF